MIECKRLAALGSVDEHKFMTTFGLALVPETVVPFDPPRVDFKISERLLSNGFSDSRRWCVDGDEYRHSERTYRRPG